MVQRVVINKCYGGFGLSEEAIEWMRERYPEVEEMTTLPGEEFSDGSGPSEYVYTWDIPRDHEGLVEVVRELGKDASGQFAELQVVEVPDEVDWKVEEYGGLEKIVEGSSFSYS